MGTPNVHNDFPNMMVSLVCEIGQQLRITSRCQSGKTNYMLFTKHNVVGIQIVRNPTLNTNMSLIVRLDNYKRRNRQKKQTQYLVLTGPVQHRAQAFRVGITLFEVVLLLANFYLK